MARHEEAHQKKIYLWGTRRAFGRMLVYNINIRKHGMGVWKFIEQLWKRVFQVTRALSKISRSVGYQFFAKLFKLFLPSYNYLRYLCHMHIFLGL
jgi:hypothetical protein